jgi:ATP-dependent DNA helicase RecG
MSTFDPKRKVLELIKLPAETEVVEFKEAKSSFDFNDLGKYLKALKEKIE